MKRELLRCEAAVVRFEEAAVFAILVVLVTTLALQVASRFLFKFPLDWTEELARVGQMWLVFIGAAVGAHRAEHFVVELFMARVDFPGKRVVARIVDVLVVGFFLALALVSARHAAFAAIQQLTALRVSIAVSYAALPIGCALIAFHFAMAWVRPLPHEAAALEAGE